MRLPRLVAFLSLVGAAAGFSAAGPAFAATDGSVLSFGSTGQTVSVLQRDLQTLGYFPKGEGITQYFGPITKKAVLAFEKDRGFAQTGSVTQAVLTAVQADAAKAAGGGTGQFAPARPETLGERIAAKALTFVGTPYVWGGTSPSGFDCSGFTQYVFAQFGITLPRTAAEQDAVGAPVAKGDLQPGDLVFFDTGGNGVSHVGIYIGGGKFVDAASTGVEVDVVDDPYYWGSRYVNARRVN